MQNRDYTERQIEIIEAATLRIDQFGIQELTIKNLAADLNLSEAALYRHFKSKNEILLGLLNYFISEMKERISIIMANKQVHPTDILKQIFFSQLKTFVNKPSFVCVIFAEGIFQFNKDLLNRVSYMIDMMQKNVETLIEKGQNDGNYATLLSKAAISTIIMGSMRMVVLKWKLSGYKSELVNDGETILNGLLKMIEK